MTSVYSRFYRLQEDPFSLTPDPKFFYSSDVYQEALMGVVYGVSQRRGIIVLTGEAGVGKTTILYKVKESLGSSVKAIFLPSPHATFNEILEYLLHELQIPPETSKLSMLRRLQEFLVQELECGNNVALFIDEAQSADLQELEDIRLLSNIQTSEAKLLQIVFAGQPEFQERLDNPRLLPLRQRVAIHCRLQPLGLKEVGNYIRVRLEVAGVSDPAFFSDDAVAVIAQRSLGVPRLINLACDQALLTAYSLGRQQVDETIMREALADILPDPSQVRTATVHSPQNDKVQNSSFSHALTKRMRKGFAYFGKLGTHGKLLMFSLLSLVYASTQLLRKGFSYFSKLSMHGKALMFSLLSLVYALPRALRKGFLYLGQLSMHGKALMLSTLSFLRHASTRLLRKGFAYFSKLSTYGKALMFSLLSLVTWGLSMGERSLFQRFAKSIRTIAIAVLVVIVGASVYLTFGQTLLRLDHKDSVEAPASRTMERAVEATAAELGAGMLPDINASTSPQESQSEKISEPVGKVLALLREVRNVAAPRVAALLNEITVQSGDTLTRLAAEQYGAVTLTVLDLLRIANPSISDITHLSVGQRLRFPDLDGAVRVLREKDGSYSYLLLSTSSKKEALYHSSMLAKKGYASKVVSAPLSPNRMCYRVQIGGFHSKQAAAARGAPLERVVMRDPRWTERKSLID